MDWNRHYFHSQAIYESLDSINSIYIKINQKKILNLNQDATIFHELSHSIIPFLEDTPIWFYEGLATFYENYYLKMNSKINYQERISFLKLNLKNPSSYSNKKNYYLGEAYFLLVDECIKKTNDSFHEVWKKKNNLKISESENFTSLSDRFGIWLGFHNFSNQQFIKIVFSYCNLYNLKLDKEQIKKKALEWSVQRGSNSGREAVNLARYLLAENNNNYSNR